jgi:hypothetical protein
MPDIIHIGCSGTLMSCLKLGTKVIPLLPDFEHNNTKLTAAPYGKSQFWFVKMIAAGGASR